MDVRRIPGEGRYAQLEREQRWVLRDVPDGLVQPTAILDRYLTGTRLRLRRATSGADVTYKLGQKVRPDPASPAMVKLTNMYLSAAEYALLGQLPGEELRKTRWLWPAVPGRVVVDVFEGRLAGLVLAETELGPDDSPLAGLPLDPIEVTDDDRFSGGALCGLSTDQVAALLPPG